MELVTVIRAFVERYDGKFVYLRRKDSDFAGGKLSLPGGKLEKGETHRKAILRELFEETRGVPDHKIKYCFSQKPKEYNGKLYQQDYFHLDIELDKLSPDEETTSISLLWAQDALLKEDVAFSDGVAHHFYETIRRKGIHVLDWDLANTSFQETGILPEPRVYAPHHNPISEKEKLAAWMKENPIPRVRIVMNTSDINRQLARQGYISRSEAQEIEKGHFKRAQEALNFYLMTLDPNIEDQIQELCTKIAVNMINKELRKSGRI